MPPSEVVLVTGASSGIGQITAEVLADAGYTVFGTSRRPQSARANGFTMLQLDVTQPESISACVATVLEKAGRIDVLVNNAGIPGTIAASEEQSSEQLRRLFETNFFGAVNMTKAVLPLMRKQGRGVIINIGSIGGLLAPPFTTAYASAKFALEGYSEALRLELAAAHLPIRVHILEPGFYRTEIDQAFEEPANPLDVYEAIRSQVAMMAQYAAVKGRDPREIALAILSILQHENAPFRQLLGSDALAGGTLKRILPFALVETGERWLYSGVTVDRTADSESQIRQLGVRAQLLDGKAMDDAQPVVLMGLLALSLLVWNRLFRRR